MTTTYAAPVRVFRSHPARVPQLVQSLATRGTEFILNPPELRVRFYEQPTQAELRALDELRPYVFEYLIGCARAEGRFFCHECALECKSFVGGTRPNPGDEVVCAPCFRGQLSFARLVRMGRRHFGPYWFGDN
jgi:hypothetical protein